MTSKTARVAASLERYNKARTKTIPLADLSNNERLLRAALTVFEILNKSEEMDGVAAAALGFSDSVTRRLQRLQEKGLTVETSEGWSFTEEFESETELVEEFDRLYPLDGSLPASTSGKVRTGTKSTNRSTTKEKTMATATKTGSKAGSKRKSSTSTGTKRGASSAKGKASTKAKDEEKPKATRRPKGLGLTDAQLDEIQQMRDSGTAWKPILDQFKLTSAIPLRKALAQRNADKLPKITARTGAQLAKKVAEERKKDTGFYILAIQTGKTETELKELLEEHGYGELNGRVYFKDPAKAEAREARKAAAAEKRKAAKASGKGGKTGGKSSGKASSRRRRGGKAAEDPSDEA